MARYTQLMRGNTSTLWRVGVPSYDANGERIPGQYEDLSSNYTCTIAVLDATPAISRAVTALSADNTRFLAQLTPAETATIAIGKTKVAIQVVNATTTPPFTVEHHIDLDVQDDLI